MRALTTGAGILVAGVMVVIAWWIIVRWNERRSEAYLRRKVMEQEAILAMRTQLYLGYDAAVDTIERLLAQDESRLFLTPDEIHELREHVERFNRIQQGATE